MAWAPRAAPVGGEVPGTLRHGEHQEAELRRAAAGDQGYPARDAGSARLGGRPSQPGEEAEGAKDDVHPSAAEELLWTQPPRPRCPPIPRGPRRPLAGAARHPDLPEPVRGQSREAHHRLTQFQACHHCADRPFAVIEVSRARRLAGSQTVGGGLCADVSPGLAGRAVDRGGEPGRGSTEPNERPGLGEAAALEKPGS